MSWDGPSPAFKEMVRQVYEWRSQREGWGQGPPSTKDELWNSFLSPLLLGPRISSAQAVYGKKEVLGDSVAFEQAVDTMESRDWEESVCDKIENERPRIKGTRGEGAKRSMLDYIERNLDSGDLIRSVSSVAQFIEEGDFPSKLREIRGNLDAEFEFVCNSLDKYRLHGVKYVKFVQWMHLIDTGVRLTPPSGVIQGALEDTNAPGSLGRGQDGHTRFWEICRGTRDHADAMRSDIADDLWEREVQNALWVLGSTRGLLAGSQSAKQNLDAAALLDFLEQTDRSMETYHSDLVDVEALEDLRPELGDFLKDR